VAEAVLNGKGTERTLCTLNFALPPKGRESNGEYGKQGKCKEHKCRCRSRHTALVIGSFLRWQAAYTASLSLIFTPWCGEEGGIG
jgi:hypothetical protein